MGRQNNTGNKVNRGFTVKMQKKLVVLFGFVLLAFAGLSARLIWISRESGDKYQKQVLSQQRYDSTTLPYRRGDIVDSKGTKLATSEKVYNLVIDAKVMLDKPDYLEPTMTALQENFDVDVQALTEYVNTHPTSSWYVPLRQLTYDEISGFKQAQADNSKIRGVWFEEEYKRKYPMGTLACDVIGFTGKDNTGTYGLEEYYNDILNGINGREYGYLLEDSNLERTIKPATDGDTIHSTIDVNIQGIVEKYLKEFNDEHANAVREGNGAENLGCVVMEVDTGRILAMASYPVYDLNNTRDASRMIGTYMVEEITNAKGYQEIRKTDTMINQSVIDSMDEAQLYLNLNNLWKNYCIADTYEPGSTAKPFTVAAALETGAITGNEVLDCGGSLVKGGHTIRCHNRWGDGAVTVQNSIAWSCNVALMKIGDLLGAEDFCRFQEIFNFGLKTNIDLAGEARTAGLLYNADNMGEADLATNTFGQNFNVTMIQLIAGYCSLINGGYYYEPHMVDKITNSSGSTVRNIEPRVLKQTVSESTSEKIRQYTRATVMEEGGQQRTGKAARPAGYAIGGKTGTAQTLPRSDKEYVVSFIGHAPADDPQIAVYVVIDRLNDAKQDQAGLAAKLVRNILTEVLPYMNIFMTEELSDEEREELAARQLEVTNKYTQTPEGDAVEDGQEGDEPQDTQTPGPDQPAWMSFPIDPETGYRVDPETGEKLDPNTGDPVEDSFPAMDFDPQ